jgi:hypothetical protein
MALPERFDLERSSRWMFLASPWIMLAFAVLCGSLPFFPEDGKPRNESFLLGLSIVGGIGFSLGAWYAWQIVRRLPEAALSVDEHGLWPTVKHRDEALIPWTTIVRLREREVLQRLEAVDAAGKTVAKLEYQLKDFQRLRAIVLQRANLPRQTSSSGTYHKPAWHHIFSIGSMIGFALLGWYVGQTNQLLGYAGMTLLVAMIAWEYWNTPYQLRIASGMLEIQTPGRCQRVPRERIARVEIQDELANQAKHPAVTLLLVGGAKPVKLKALGIQAVELYQVLKSWHRGDA